MRLWNGQGRQDCLGKELEHMLYVQLKEKEQCLTATGNHLYHQQEKDEKQSIGYDVVDSTILNACMECQRQRSCQFTIEDKQQLGALLEHQGKLTTEDFRKLHPCICAQKFICQANGIYQRQWYGQRIRGQMRQWQRMIGKEYLEAGQILGQVSKDYLGLWKKTPDITRSVRRCLSKYQVQVSSVYTFCHPRDGKQIFLLARKKKSAITTKQLGRWLSKALKEEMALLPNQRRILGKSYHMIGYGVDTRFHVLSGVVSLGAREDEDNGDTFSMGSMGQGGYLSVISDGMGTGHMAREESKALLDRLEELLEGGVPQEQALSMLLVMNAAIPGEERYATLDYLHLDLYAGVGTMLKVGACPTLLKRKDHVEVLEVPSEDMGTLASGKVNLQRKKVEDGDMILQFSDGILNGLGKNAVARLLTVAKQITTTRPQSFVEEFVERLKPEECAQRKDDTTVIAIGIWEK